MNRVNALRLAVMVAAFAAGNACAQKVAPAPVFYDGAYEVTLPADNIFQIKLDGLRAVRAAWLTFAGYANARAPRDPQVITLMEGVTVRWGAPDGGCTYEFKLETGASPTISMTKSSICTLRDGEKANFRVLAM